MTARYLILEDGSVFSGEGFGAPAVTSTLVWLVTKKSVLTPSMIIKSLF